MSLTIRTPFTTSLLPSSVSISNITDVYSVSRQRWYEKVCKVKPSQDWLPVIAEMIRGQGLRSSHKVTAWEKGATRQGVGRLIVPLVLGYLCQLSCEKDTHLPHIHSHKHKHANPNHNVATETAILLSVCHTHSAPVQEITTLAVCVCRLKLCHQIHTDREKRSGA